MRQLLTLALLVALASGCGSKSSQPATCTAPTVTFRSPMTNETVFGDVPVQLNVEGACSIASVTLTADGTNVATLTSGPYSTFWDTTMLENGNYTLTGTATDSKGNTGTASIEVFALQNCMAGQPCAPNVQFVAPVSGTTACGKITLFADATDPASTPSVTFLGDGQPLGAALTQAPYLQEWDLSALTPGVHTAEADATDAAGLKARETLTLTVVAPGSCTAQGPVVALACPTPDAQGQVFCATSTVELCVDVQDANPVTSVSYAVDGTPLAGTPQGPQWSLSWDTTPFNEGTYQVQVVANDSAMLSGNQSSGFTIDRTPPTVVLTTPMNNTTDAVGSMINLVATASDTNSSGGPGCGISGVTFQFAGPIAVPSLTATSSAASPSWSVMWNTTGLTAGTYQIIAIATDRAQLTSSSSIMVTLM